MALQKDIKIPGGFITTYHVPDIKLDRKHKLLVATIMSWKDKDSSNTEIAFPSFQFVFSAESKQNQEKINEELRQRSLVQYDHDNKDVIAAYNAALNTNNEIDSWNQALEQWNTENPEDLHVAREHVTVPALPAETFTPPLDPSVLEFTFDATKPIESQVYEKLKMLVEFQRATNV